MEAQTESTSPGCLMPIAWLLVSGLITIVAVVAVGASGAGSESAGVSAAYAAAGPLGFAWGGGLAALVTHFAAKSPGARIGVPLGCGCAGAIGMVLTVFVFFAAIFPAL